MFPISNSAPRASPAYVITTLILVNTFVFLWMWSLPPRALAQVTFQYALIPLRYADPIDAQAAGLDPNDWWPLLTNTFMHGGWLHLILNMWTLWIFGPAMEADFGRIGFAVLYLCGGVAASATHLVANFTSDIPALGASGAIATVLQPMRSSIPASGYCSSSRSDFCFFPYPLLPFCSRYFGLGSSFCRARMSFLCHRWQAASLGGHTLVASCSERWQLFRCGVAYGANPSAPTSGIWMIFGIREPDFLGRGRVNDFLRCRDQTPSNGDGKPLETRRRSICLQRYSSVLQSPSRSLAFGRQMQ